MLHPQLGLELARAKMDDEHRRAQRRALRIKRSHETERERVRQSLLLRAEPDRPGV